MDLLNWNSTTQIFAHTADFTYVIFLEHLSDQTKTSGSVWTCFCLQPEVPATSVLSACHAASDDTPPQPGWRRPRGDAASAGY